MEKLRKMLSYKQIEPLIYDEKLRDSFLGASVTGSKLNGKTVLITGGSGGVGIAMALRFMVENCKVVITGRNEEKLRKTVVYLKSKMPKGDASYVLIDQCDDENIRETVQDLDKRNCSIDILINNAGVYTEVDRKRIFRKVTKEEYEIVWRTNFHGTVILTNEIASIMERKGISGSIINISSICAEFRNFQYTPYGMSKAAIIEYTRQLSNKYQSLTINVIEPGSIATTMGNLKLGDNIGKDCNILHHPALPEEIAALAAFMASGHGRYLNKKGYIASACEIL